MLFLGCSTVSPVNATLTNRVAWLMLGVGMVAAAATAAADSVNLSNAVYLFATAQLAASVLVSVRVNNPKRIVWVSLLFIVAFSIAGQLLDGSFTKESELQSIPDALFLIVQIVLVAGLLFIVARRLGSDPTSVLVDGMIVALGAWFLLWVVFLQPSIGAGQYTILDSALRGITLATSSIVVFTLVTLVFGDTKRSPTVWLITGAICLTLLGDLLYAAESSGRFKVADHFANAAYIAALFTTSAAFLHSSVSSLVDQGPLLPKRPMKGRLITTTMALLIPVVVLSLTRPADQQDRVVRAISIFVLSAAVTLRVGYSVRVNAASQRDLLHLSQTDSLTGLPNRALMLSHITHAIATAASEKRSPCVLFIDVDRFKNINDSLGHQAGDNVLVAMAQRLRHALPQHCIVGRISGDEFVILDPSSRQLTDAMHLADRILESFYEPLPLRQGDVFVSASIGVATFRADATNSAEDLLRHADTAMYRAKDAGRNCVAVFDESMLERVTQRLLVETALYRALERRELRLVHQPIIDIDLGDVVGFEALMRWQRDDGSMISPAEFIPIAEETGTIVPIGAWAMLEALTHLRGWISEGICRRDATMSVNVSPRQLQDPNFVAVVSEALLRAHVPADQLWLEVTEGVMISQPEQALSTLKKLCALGVRVAIDDFGTGYSSLSLLQRFPISRLKIDQSFGSAVADDAGARSLVRTIIAMGESLNLDMVAEGVETVRQLQVLSELRCAKAQGYLISHPVAPEQMAATVAALDKLGPWPRLREI